MQVRLPRVGLLTSSWINYLLPSIYRPKPSALGSAYGIPSLGAYLSYSLAAAYLTARPHQHTLIVQIETQLMHIMPSNKLSVLFDRTLRPSRSISNLFQPTPDEPSLVATSRRSKSREHLSILVDYGFDQPSSAPYHTSPSPPPSPPKEDEAIRRKTQRPTRATVPLVTARPVSAHRTNSTPTMHPPDELFLKIIRRRSATARLEEQRIPIRRRKTYTDDDIAMSVAIASALPPQYFDLPPEYESPQRANMFPRSRERATTNKPKDDELFVDPLHMQIDQVIADFRGIRMTEATPVRSTISEPDDALVSPINEVDNIYLERRRQLRWQQLQHEHDYQYATR